MNRKLLHEDVTFEQLPQEIIKDEVAPHLDMRTIGAFRVTSKTMHTLFQVSSDTAKLLDDVQEANYPNAQKRTEANLALITRYVSYKNADGTYETTSPAKKAFAMKDAYMWIMFLKIILGMNIRTPLHLLTSLPTDLAKYKNSHILVYPDLYSINEKNELVIVKIKGPVLLKSFLKQAYEQKEYINLEPFFDEYKAFNKYIIYGNQDQLDTITKQAIDKAFLRISKKLRDELPRHMLREFCRKESSWSAESKFDVNVEPSPIATEVDSENTKRNVAVLPLAPHSGLGFDFSLIRSILGRARAVKQAHSRIGAMCVHVSNDLLVFRRLCEVRTSDLAILQSQAELALKLENTNKMQLR